MDQDNNELEVVQTFKEVLKPNLFQPIWNTIICSGPPLNLFFRYFIERDIKNPTVTIILSVIAMIWTIINWYWYVKDRIEFAKQWKTISVKLEALNYKEKTSKDYGDIILNILQITAIVSLVAFFIFFAIVVFFKLSYFKYFMLFSILLFLLTGIVMLFIFIIQFFSFLKEVKKEGRLKSVLIRFSLIFTLLFFIQVIIIFIVHKNIDWVRFIITSFIATIPIIVSIEVVVLCKKLMKEYSVITSPEESDSKSNNWLEM